MLTAEFDLASSTEPADREAQGQPNLGKVPNGMVGSDDAMASSRGCWDTKATGYAKNQMGNTLYTFWTVLNWCSNGNKVTSAKIVEADGETSTPGWRYEGVKAKAAKVMNDFYARGYSKHLFILGIGGWDVQNMNACIRTFGYRDGSPGISDYVCSLY